MEYAVSDADMLMFQNPEVQPDYEGMLMKKAALVPKWAERHFQLYGEKLAYFREGVIMGCFDLTGSKVTRVNGLVFHLSGPRLHRDDVQIRAATHLDLSGWLRRLAYAGTIVPFTISDDSVSPSAPETPTPPEGGWTCSRCTLVNSIRQYNCGACGACGADGEQVGSPIGRPQPGGAQFPAQQHMQQRGAAGSPPGSPQRGYGQAAPMPYARGGAPHHHHTHHHQLLLQQQAMLQQQPPGRKPSIYVDINSVDLEQQRTLLAAIRGGGGGVSGGVGGGGGGAIMPMEGLEEVQTRARKASVFVNVEDIDMEQQRKILDEILSSSQPGSPAGAGGSATAPVAPAAQSSSSSSSSSSAFQRAIPSVINTPAVEAAQRRAAVDVTVDTAPRPAGAIGWGGLEQMEVEGGPPVAAAAAAAAVPEMPAPQSEQCAEPASCTAEPGHGVSAPAEVQREAETGGAQAVEVEVEPPQTQQPPEVIGDVEESSMAAAPTAPAADSEAPGGEVRREEGGEAQARVEVEVEEAPFPPIPETSVNPLLMPVC